MQGYSIHRTRSLMSKPPPESVVVRVSADPKEEREKPDDYDKVSRPLRALRRLLFLPLRVLKGVLLGLWRRLFGPRPKP